MALTSPECPKCHQSNKVEKVSDIVADGFSIVPEEGTEPFAWAGETYYIRYTERSRTERTPDKPKNKSSKRQIVTSKKILYSWDPLPRTRVTNSPLADRLLPKMEKPDLPGDITKSMGCFNIFLWPFLIRRLTNWVYRNMEADYTQKLLKSNEAQEKWAKLFYCYRCEGIFTEAKDSAFIPVQQLTNYLFDLDAARWLPKNPNSPAPGPSHKE